MSGCGIPVPRTAGCSLRYLVVGVGRFRNDPAAALFEHYRRRLGGDLVLREVEAPGGSDRAEREGGRLMAAVPAGAVLVVLDERGEVLPSRVFAERLVRWRDDGRRTAAFLIGGADGHAQTVRDRADMLLSFGPMTWPHLMVRAMLAEQLYRARTLMDGHPYHRG